MMNAAESLSGKKALITGAGGGLGSAIALTLAQSGADIAAWDMNPEALERAAKPLRALGVKVVTRLVNVTEVEQLDTIVRETAAELGGLDILVNNAGVNHPCPALEVTSATWDKILDINLKGSFFVAQAVARYMIQTAQAQGRQQCNGRIVNISSSLSQAVMPDRLPYLASKGGVNLITKGMALEWACHGITVNAVGPAIVDTEMTRSMGSNKGVHPKMLLGRLVKPEEISAAVAYLVSEGAAAVTGQVLFVDAGWTIH